MVKIPKYYPDSPQTSGQQLELQPEWMLSKGGLPKEAVDFAEAFGKYLIDPQSDSRRPSGVRAGWKSLTTSQLRNFFGEIRRIQAQGFQTHQSDFYMLKPKLAYAKARVLKNSRDNRIIEFEKVLNLLIDKVYASGNEEHFTNFVKFVEAIVAYHKAFGGKD